MHDARPSVTPLRQPVTELTGRLPEGSTAEDDDLGRRAPVFRTTPAGS